MPILCGSFAADELAAAERKRIKTINVQEATYGGNCGVPKGNVTRFVAAACADTDLCNYRIHYKAMRGDPAAPGCVKDFSVTYTCGKGSKRETCTAPPEAGAGGEGDSNQQFLSAALHGRAKVKSLKIGNFCNKIDPNRTLRFPITC